MAYLVSSNPRQLVVLARRKLGLTQKEFAHAIGSSHRTVVRWEADRSSPADFHLHKLATLIHPVDADLAHDAALAGGKTLEELGIVAPAPAEPAPAPSLAPPAASESATPAPPPPAPVPTPMLVDSVVCAALAALEEQPLLPRLPVRAMQAVLFAAFARAQDLWLEAGEVADALAPRASTPAPPASPTSPPAAAAPAEAASRRSDAVSGAARRRRARARRKGGHSPG